MDNSVKQNYLIRIVDDDAGVLKGLSFLLACTGWKSVAYTTPLEFLEKDDLSVPGCILLDIRMPGMSGRLNSIRKERLYRSLSLPGTLMWKLQFGQ